MQIKIRAWDKVNNRMQSWEELLAGKEFKSKLQDPEAHGMVLMMWTGLTDKNGKEIYEGDIFIHKNNHKFVVKWDEDRFIGLDNNKNGDGYCCYISSCDKSGNSAIEVIGNIYENPELIQKEGNPTTK